METYVKIPFLIIAILFFIHIFFIAGKTYNIETYDSIMNTELIIVGLVVAVVIVIAVKAMSLNSKLKNSLKEWNKRYVIKKKIILF